jgi:hypothetical protein
MSDRKLGMKFEGINPPLSVSPAFAPPPCGVKTVTIAVHDGKEEKKDSSAWTEAPFWEVYDFRGLTTPTFPIGPPSLRRTETGIDVGPMDEGDDFVVCPPRFRPEPSARPGGSLYAPPAQPRPNFPRRDSSWNPGSASRSLGGYSWPTTWVD